MPERISMELSAELRKLRSDMHRFMQSTEQRMQRVEGKQRQLNKQAGGWANNILTSAKHLASAYVTFQGIATVQDTISWYFNSWTQELQEVEKTTTRIVDAFKQVQLQTIKAGDNWERIREQVEGTMEQFGIEPTQGWKQYETIRSVLSRLEPEERQASMRAVGMHQAITTMDPSQLASIHARFRRMYPEMEPMRLQSIIERTIGRAPAGGERLKKFLKYQVRAGTAAKSWDIPMEAMLAMGTEMAGVTANPGRAMKHLQILWREMMENPEVQPKGEGPFALLRGLRERWGQQKTQEELREIVQNTDMSSRIMEKIGPLLERLPQMQETYRELQATTGEDLTNAFDKVMKRPTSFLEAIKNKAETIVQNTQAQNENMQRWSTTFKSLEGLGSWMVHQKKWVSPAMAETMVGTARSYYKYTPGATRAQAMKLALGTSGLGLTKEQRRQAMQKLKGMTTLRGRSLRAARRLYWQPNTGGLPFGGMGQMTGGERGAGVGVRSIAEANRAAFNRRVRRGVRQNENVFPNRWGFTPHEQFQLDQAEREEAKQDTKDMKRYLRQQLNETQRRSHSSDRAGARP